MLNRVATHSEGPKRVWRGATAIDRVGIVTFLLVALIAVVGG